jgi:hypothetical protein
VPFENAWSQTRPFASKSTISPLRLRSDARAAVAPEPTLDASLCVLVERRARARLAEPRRDLRLVVLRGLDAVRVRGVEIPSDRGAAGDRSVVAHERRANAAQRSYVRRVFIGIAVVVATANCSARGSRVRDVEPAPGFVSFSAPPFIVHSNAPPKALDHAAHSIAWAHDVLHEFFDARPPPSTPIWIFRDRQSLIDHAVASGGNAPAQTIYGVVQYQLRSTPFYNPWTNEISWQYAGKLHRSSLRHEIVHVYVQADCPRAPIWLNEGLASYFEGAWRDANGRITGDWVTFPLFLLIRAIEHHREPSISEVVGAGYVEFHGGDERLFYGVAQYLVYWLAWHDLLAPFYGEYRRRRAEDPTGLATLRAVTRRDIADLQIEWETFMLDTWRREAGP